MLAWVMNLDFAGSGSSAPAAPTLYRSNTFLLIGACLWWMGV